MKSLKVSVIIPVYNTEEYVAEALKCITNQSLTNIEIIVIDDGSTDSSYRIIKEMADQDDRIKIYSQANKGQSAARNLGISIAQGEYIYFMDSDDLLENNTFLECYKKCQKEELDIVFFDAEVFGPTKNTFNLNYRRCHLIKDTIYSGPAILRILLKTGGYRASPCLVFFRLAYLRKINLTFYPGIIHEDELFTFLLLIQAERVSFINKTYFKRRLRRDSTMAAKLSRKNLNGYFTVANELKKIKHHTNDKKLRSLVNLRLSGMLNDILYSARTMQKGDRNYALFYSVSHYRRYLPLKNMSVLAFISLKDLKGVKLQATH